MDRNQLDGRTAPAAPDAIDIRDFCDMDRFEQMMKDWATGTGLATVAVGRDGAYISSCYNFTDFCQNLTRKSPEGLRRCVECDRRGSGTYLCHAGLVDFAAPITLDDGTLLGSIIGGQVLPEQPDEERFRATARELGIDPGVYLAALHKVNIRTREEIQASADLLANVINLFVRTSYAARKNAASLTERARIISSLSKIYFCDYYIDMDRDTFLELDAAAELHRYVDRQGRAGALMAYAGRCFAEGEHEAELRAFLELSTLKQRIGKRQSITFEFFCRNPGWCRAAFIAVDRDGQGLASHVIFAIQDIQEEKEQELKNRLLLKKTADEANRANHAKTDFLSRMSHDIRTPLNGIIGMTYLARQEQNSAKTADYLAKIDTSSQFLLGLINDILDMTKAESNRIELHPEPYPFEEFCAYLDAVIRPLCLEKQQTFILDADPLPGLAPLVDVTRLNRICFNLLSNAVKYTPEGGTITLTVRERLLPDARFELALTVRDNGIGMSQAFQRHLFEPFMQENRDDNSAARGSGLGLAIVKKTVEAMGGTIRVRSERDRGSKFQVVLVTPCAEKSGAGKEKPWAEERCAGLAGRHVLLCEDHPLNQEIARALLSGKGMIVQVAEDGQKGVDAFSKAPVGYFHCVLMDLRMPVMDGIEAAKAIRSMDRPDAGTVPILAMTADAFSDDVKKCLKAGMNGHVAKPIDPQKLYDTLAEIIEGARAD